MRELVSIHIGQAGIQMGNAAWELYCLEHGINPDGTPMGEFSDQNEPASIFYRTDRNKFVPRALMVDLEPSVIDQVKASKYGSLYHPQNLVHGKEDAANNYARGNYTVGKEMLEPTVDEIKRIIERCDSTVQGFLIYHSFGGGTGSGFTAALMDQLNYISKASKLEFAIYPSPKLATAVVEPYNSVLTTHTTIANSNCTFLVDNEAIYSICQRLGIERPAYNDINRIIAQVSSSISASLRFKGDLNVDVAEFQTNLVPYPRIHFPIVSYAPIYSQQKSYHETNDVNSLVRACYSQENQMVKCDIFKGKFISSVLLFRGDVNSHDANKSLVSYRNGRADARRFSFVEWCPTGFKIGINSRKPTVVPDSAIAETSRSVCTLSNTTAISSAWVCLRDKFDKMFNKRAFVHWYVSEGMEEGEFSEARENLETLINEYDAIEAPVSADEY